MKQLVLEGPLLVESRDVDLKTQLRATHDVFQHIPGDHVHTNMSHVTIKSIHSDAVVYLLSEQ